MISAELLQALDELESIPNEEWIGGLSSRKLKELEFHDRDRNRKLIEVQDSDTYDQFYGNKKYYTSTTRSKQYVSDWISNHAKGKVFLDYACGNGFQAIHAAKCGANLAIGIDISRVSVLNARNDARDAGVSLNTRFAQADAENTRLPSNSIDAVLCSGMLHHLDLSYALPELRRILKPGGKILAVEALDYNPAIKAYRWLTPKMRTEWEAAHILNLRDIEFARRFFRVTDMQFWHLVGILAPHTPYLPMGIFDHIDRILERIPFVQLMAWIFTFVMTKPHSESSR